VTKSDSWIDYSTLEGCLREDLENKAHRGMAVLDPVKLVLTNWDEVFAAQGGAAYLDPCTLPALPHSAARGHRQSPAAPLQSAARCGLSAKTLKKCRPRATSACSPATRCA
jgi:glutamyl/glutaminyl-tRNA synthetase